MGTDVLFENHTIKEIQEIEKKLRNDIEKKKEELRQMVGERYRDLMEAADTITEMKDIAESVTVCVKSIESGCVQLENSPLEKGIMNTIHEKVDRKKKKYQLLYVIASQVKILIDSPSKIWAFIESKDFVNAVSLYLLARHVHSLLNMDPIYREHNISALFPIVSRQWTSVSQFRQLLLQNCQLVLENQNTEPEEALAPLCCSCLLTNSSLQHTLLEVLNIRKNVIKSIFNPEKYAKLQICEFVTVVQMTLKIIYVLLYPEIKNESGEDNTTNMLHWELTKLISKNSPGPVSLLDLKSSGMFRFLPDAINDFRPILATKPDPCSVEMLQSKCTEWMHDIKAHFQKEIRSLLNFVSSVQSLTIIREAVFEKVFQIKNWDQICHGLLKGPFSLWDFFLKECFIERIEDVINEQLKSASESCQKDIEETLHKIGLPNENHKLQYEKNVSSYVWRESAGDILENMAWNPRHHRNYWNSGELSMKAMGFTPKVQKICKDLDNHLLDILGDSTHFCCFQRPTFNDPVCQEIYFAVQKLEADITKEADAIYSFLAEGAQKNMFDLANFIGATLSYLEQEPSSTENSHRIILLGHLCHGLTNLCPHINSSLSAEKLGETLERCRRQGTPIVFAPPSAKESDLWKNLKKKFQEIYAAAFRLWNKNEILTVMNSLNTELISVSPEALLKSLLQWDKIEIQEESEEGKSVKSVLRIPQHLSTPIENALFSYCCELNTIGGSSICSDVRTAISKDLLIELLKLCKSKVDMDVSYLNSHLLQVLSLQMLFDVQFLIGLVVLKDNLELSSLSSYIINQAMSRVDPFDMDVFSSPLQQNIKKALQKSLSLFGLIASPDQVSLLNMKSQSISSPMDPNIMLTCNTGSRLPLLPLPTRSADLLQDLYATKSQEGGNGLPLHHAHSSSPNLNASDHPTNSLKPTTSFYERVTAMGSAWWN